MPKVQGKIIRLKNRRVFMGKNEDGFICMFKRLDDCRKVQETTFILTPEAMFAFVQLYFEICSEGK
jgi:hypothetical protein